jgi:hypothetical protein
MPVNQGGVVVVAVDYGMIVFVDDDGTLSRGGIWGMRRDVDR